MTLNYVILIPLLPLLAGITIGLCGSRLGEKSWKVGAPAQALACLISLWTLYTVTVQGPIRVGLFPLSTQPGAWFQFALYVDRLSAVMMALITGVSFIVHAYSIQYMQGERGYARFYALLGLITFVLLCLVCSANLFMLFVFWQLVSWLLYLLLAFNYAHPPAYDAAFKTFIVHRLGDVAFLYGVLLTYHLYGTLDFDLLFTRAAEAPEMLALWPGGLEISAITVITLVIFIGAMAKSAQFPLHAWLPDTMDTPTPVSALMHAGIVNAGGFLLNRLAPLYGLSSTTLHIVFVIGGLTTLLGASMMLLQNDIKKTLGFSTMGQMGYMIMECGLGAFALAIFHLIAHGMFKATHFLNAGQVIHAARREPKRPHAGGIRERTPFSRLTWLTGAALTLILPLIILLTAHEVWSVPLRDAQGAVIFLFFGWVTASQTIFSLYRLNAVASWKVAGAMMFALLFIGFTYLWAGEAFTYFLYPAPDVVAQFFQAAALPTWLFDLLVVLTTMMIVIVWAILYAKAQGKHVPLPSWVTSMMPALYVLFMNRLYIDALYAKLGYGIIRLCHRLESRW